MSSITEQLTGECPVPEVASATEWFWAVYTSLMHFWYVYILRSQKDHEFYIGSTNDLKRRIKEHQYGKNISTAKRLPLELIYFEGHKSKEDAIRRETYLKTTKGRTMLRQILKESLHKEVNSLV